MISPTLKAYSAHNTSQVLTSYQVHLEHLLSGMLVTLCYLELKEATFSLVGTGDCGVNCRFTLTTAPTASKTGWLQQLEGCVTPRGFANLANEKGALKIGLIKDGGDTAADFLTYDFIEGEVRWNIRQLDLSPGLLPFFLDTLEHVFTSQFSRFDQLSWISASQFNFIQRQLTGKSQGGPATDSSLAALLQKACLSNKTATAYTYSGRHLSFEQFNGYANYYAHLLTEKQVVKGDLVFVCLDNGLELPVAYFACMKAGAVFVPVDPLWPESRLAALEEKFRPACILTSDRLTCSEFQSQVLRINLDRAALVNENPSIDVSGTDLLYAFFTSGSTGMPKCCLNRHDGLINRFNYMSRKFDVSPGKDVVLQNSSHLFDSSLWQLLWPLLNGVQVVIPPRTTGPDIDHMLDLVERYQVTMTDFVPSIFNLLVQKLDDQPALRNKLRSARYLVVGGEESNISYLKKFHTLYPGIQLVNTYGHTEASIGMVFNFMHPPSMDRDVPIGRPIDNSFVVIADEHHNIKPVGAIGRIFVGGVCVGNGYFLDEEKTAASFYKNPFHHIPAETIFNTGDYGFLDEHGLLHYKGRFDDQIKIGGIRLDLQEIEWEMQQHPAVQQAKVYYRNESKSLHAFVKAGPGIDLNELSLHVRQRLPRHAVPHSITALEKFPLNGNGKVDREMLLGKYLAALKTSPGNANGGETNVTERLVQKWRHHIGIDNITTNASYFQLGGSSLSAISMLLDIEKEFQVKLPFTDLTHDFTIENLVHLINSKKHSIALQPGQTVAEQMQQDRQEILDEISKLQFSTAKPGNEQLLLTGATGFFGSMLLAELINNTGMIVHCLVRANDLAHARARISESLEKYCAFKPSVTQLERIVPLAGDLCEPYLGLQAELFAELCANLDCIVHAGAAVDFIKSYRDLRSSNVTPIRYLAQLAATNKLKSIHFISSISVVPAPAAAGKYLVPEHIQYDFSAVPGNGYDQTKWLTESVLMEVAEKYSLSVAIYRFGEIGNYKQGSQTNGKSVLIAFLKTIIDTGFAPATDLSLDYHPGEMASRFVVNQVAAQPRTDCYNLVAGDGPLTINDLVEKANLLGGNIRIVQFPLFMEAVNKRRNTHPASHLDIIAFLLSGSSRPDPLTAVFYEGLERLDRKNYLQQCGGSNYNHSIKLLLKDMIQENQTLRPKPAFVAFGDILRRWSNSKPDHIALKDQNTSLTYSQLDDYSDRMAAHLVALGVQKGDRIAVFAHKRVECLLAIFAVLKSGAAYVPIDPKTPAVRLHGILQEVSPRVCIGQPDDLPLVQGFGDFTDMDKLLAWVPAKPTGPLPSITEQDLCYIIYTSGSTGKPKGVQICHGNTAAFFHSIEYCFVMDSEARCLTTIPYYFDGSISDTFYALYKGAFVLITPALPIPSMLIEWIEEHQVTHMVAVTSILKLLSETFLEHPHKVRSMQSILTGGEACDKQVVNSLIGAFPALTITNAYGPTEATCDSITHTIHHGNLITAKDREYPIGKPMRTIEACLVDVDEDGVGELCLGGAQVFSAYYNRPEETARAFRSINGKNYYATGDLCRLDEDDNYIFIGRKDDEVKLNGNRVHLSEIKNALSRFRGIKAVEVLTIDVRGQKQVCSFFEPGDALAYDDFEKLRDHLKNSLPAYMLPRYYLQIKDWPLTPTQKIDRGKLRQIIELGCAERSIYFNVQEEKAVTVIP